MEGGAERDHRRLVNGVELTIDRERGRGRGRGHLWMQGGGGRG